ncbi:MAG: hypothetical protein NVSMB13_12550 [Mycobacteriales bacterium]
MRVSPGAAVAPPPLPTTDLPRVRPATGTSTGWATALDVVVLSPAVIVAVFRTTLPEPLPGSTRTKKETLPVLPARTVSRTRSVRLTAS